MRLTKSYNERPITHNPCSCGFQRLVGLGFRLGFGICIRWSSDCNWQQVLLRSNQRLPYRQIGVIPSRPVICGCLCCSVRHGSCMLHAINGVYRRYESPLWLIGPVPLVPPKSPACWPMGRC